MAFCEARRWFARYIPNKCRWFQEKHSFCWRKIAWTKCSSSDFDYRTHFGRGWCLSCCNFDVLLSCNSCRLFHSCPRCAEQSECFLSFSVNDVRLRTHVTKFNEDLTRDELNKYALYVNNFFPIDNVSLNASKNKIKQNSCRGEWWEWADHLTVPIDFLCLKISIYPHDYYIFGHFQLFPNCFKAIKNYPFQMVNLNRMHSYVEQLNFERMRLLPDPLKSKYARNLMRSKWCIPPTNFIPINYQCFPPSEYNRSAQENVYGVLRSWTPLYRLNMPTTNLTTELIGSQATIRDKIKNTVNDYVLTILNDPSHLSYYWDSMLQRNSREAGRLTCVHMYSSKCKYEKPFILRMSGEPMYGLGVTFMALIDLLKNMSKTHAMFDSSFVWMLHEKKLSLKSCGKWGVSDEWHFTEAFSFQNIILGDPDLKLHSFLKKHCDSDTFTISNYAWLRRSRLYDMLPSWFNDYLQEVVQLPSYSVFVYSMTLQKRTELVLQILRNTFKYMISSRNFYPQTLKFNCTPHPMAVSRP
nr:NSP1 [Rotavirus A]